MLALGASHSVHPYAVAMTPADRWTPPSLDAVREVTFSRNRRGLDGYETGEVDDFIQQVAARMVRGEDLGPLVHHARFQIVRSGGYDAGQVDDFLDRLVASSPPDGEAPPAKQGWFRRLFG